MVAFVYFNAISYQISAFHTEKTLHYLTILRHSSMPSLATTRIPSREKSGFCCDLNYQPDYVNLEPSRLII